MNKLYRLLVILSFLGLFSCASPSQEDKSNQLRIYNSALKIFINEELQLFPHIPEKEEFYFQIGGFNEIGDSVWVVRFLDKEMNIQGVVLINEHRKNHLLLCLPGEWETNKCKYGIGKNKKLLQIPKGQILE